MDQEYNPPKAVKRLLTVHGCYENALAAPTMPMCKPGHSHLLQFGQVRPYKNVETLISAVRSLDRTDFDVRITGRCCDPDYGEALVALAASDQRVVLDLRPEILGLGELEQEIDDSDGVVLPYKQILNSGAVFHALGRLRPVLAPRHGGFPELQEVVGPEWLHLYKGELSAEILEEFILALRTNERRQRPNLGAYGWDRVGRDLQGFLSELGLRPQA